MGRQAMVMTLVVVLVRKPRTARLACYSSPFMVSTKASLR
jgi:hypothetical protein